MAYAPFNSTGTPNPFRLEDSQPIAGQRKWQYVSTHTQATVGTSDFWSDGKDLGAKVGDTVTVIGSTTYVRSEHSVTAVGSTYTSLSAGLLISSAS
jgi:hypothetical protein